MLQCVGPTTEHPGLSPAVLTGGWVLVEDHAVGLGYVECLPAGGVEVCDVLAGWSSGSSSIRALAMS